MVKPGTPNSKLGVRIPLPLQRFLSREHNLIGKIHTLQVCFIGSSPVVSI